MSRKMRREHAQFKIPPGLDRFPSELTEFLVRDTYSLVIKGESGTGKTTLALTILKALQPLQNVLYLSTRTSPLQLFEYFPWIEEVFGPPKPLHDNVAGSTSEEGWETLIDSRLDEPSTSFERITNVLMDKHAPMVVIDSWEALGDNLGSEALRTNLRVLEKWRERAGARFVFIGESQVNTAIDFMVEGIVLLKERSVLGRRLRELVLSKLHGVRIRKPSRFFTLEGGSFRSFPEYHPDDYSLGRNPLPIGFQRPFKSVKRRIPTGHAALDLMLNGGLAQKSLTLLDLDLDVDPRVGLVFLSKLIKGWTSNGGNVLLHCPDDLDRAFLKQYSELFERESGKMSIWEAPGREEMKRTRKGSSLLTVVSLPAQGSKDWSTWADGLREMRRRADLTIAIRTGDTRRPFLEVATTRLRILKVEGTLFVTGDVPWTPLLGVVPGTSSGKRVMMLEQVV